MIDRPAVVAVAAGRARRRWHSLVLLGVSAGLVGGSATAAFAGARRAATAYDRLVEVTDFPDGFAMSLEGAPGLPDQIAASPAVDRAVELAFAVGRDRSQRNQVLVPVQASREPASHPLVVRGRPPDPAAAEEVTLSEAFSTAIGFDVGDTFAYEGLDRAEFADLFRDRWNGSASGLRIDLQVVGVTRSPTDAVLGDFPTLVGTPALLERLEPEMPDARLVWVHLRDGATLGDLEADLAEGSPGLAAMEITDLTTKRRTLDDAVVILVWGLLAFGAMAFAAGAVVLAQLVARALERSSSEDRVLRDLGLDPRSRRVASAAPGLVSVAVAAVTTVAVAAAGSPWTPIGVAREVEPSPGVEWNVTFCLVGSLLAVAVLSAMFLVAGRQCRRRTSPVGRLAGSVSELLQAGPVGSAAATWALGAGSRIGQPYRPGRRRHFGGRDRCDRAVRGVPRPTRRRAGPLGRGRRPPRGGARACPGSDLRGAGRRRGGRRLRRDPRIDRDDR